MKFLNENDIIFVQGSGKKPYEVKKVGGVVSCSCPAWRNLGGPIDNRICKHIKKEVDPACLLPQALSARNQSPDVKEEKKEVQPPPILLAHNFTDEDPVGWWISEKYDGVRAWWTGTKFLSREGNEYHAPEFFKKHLPNVVLDGELWVGRNKFQETVSIVTNKYLDGKNVCKICFK